MPDFAISFDVRQTAVLGLEPQTARLSDLLDNISIGDVTFRQGRRSVVIPAIPVLHFSLELIFAVEKAIFLGDTAWVSVTETPHIARVAPSGGQLDILIGGELLSANAMVFCRACGEFVSRAFQDAMGAVPDLVMNPAFASAPLLRHLLAKAEITKG
jgi:hypothetical protein